MANFCRNGIILSQREHSCDERGKTMFLCEVRKSMKGQVFCFEYSDSSLSRAHKHNLCRVGRCLRDVSVRREPNASTTLRAKKQELLGDEREE
jgi:hypothetical protein